ncbi:MAG: pyruvate ferredoxin oxidoreductase [Chloroflexi bacterium]|nr:pyruvate ferredoxin oxidoreductase [Chloroflexota bacterium]
MKTRVEPAPELLSPGHTACRGCGLLVAARLALQAAGPRVIVANATGCLEITTSKFPQSSWNVPWIHSLFENTAAVASGVEAALKALGRQAEARVIAQAGDGGTADIGLQSLSGMLERGHDVLYICYDNEAYMNTGIQRSSLTPLGARTSTTPPGALSWGEVRTKKDMPAIAAAHGIPYVATASIAYPPDLVKKVKRALGIRGPKYLQVHSSCPLGWGHDSSLSIRVARLAVQTGLYPLYEVINGQLTNVKRLSYRSPVAAYLKPQRRFEHLFKPGGEALLAQVQALANANAAKYGFPPVTEGAEAEDSD